MESGIGSFQAKTPRAGNTWGFLFHLELAEILSIHVDFRNQV